jgi:hypothetical protein
LIPNRTNRPEGLFWPRLIAALSELGCAAWLAWVWLHPERAGLDGVLAAFAVVVLEGPLLVGLFALFAFVTPTLSLKDRIVSLGICGCAVMMAIWMSTSIVDNLQAGLTLYLFGVLAGTFVAKWMMFLDGRRNLTFFEPAKVVVQAITLVVCYGLATSFAPPGGFDADTVARLHVPEVLDFLGRQPGPVDDARDVHFHPPWRVIAGGAIYFALYGAFRFLTFTLPLRDRRPSFENV